jgi:beta-N-acetylhexosaminidase
MPKRKTDQVQTLIGQLLVIGFEGTEMSPGLAALLRRVQPAGVILFARNITSPGQTWQLLRDCQACVAAPLFTCVDMEGGRVDRLKNIIAPAPAPADVFASGDRRLFRRHGKLIGESCRAVGFNTDLAPVVDLACENARKVMASRVVSPDPKKTVIYAREFLQGLQSAGVVGCGKHFPGLGEAQLDTHHDLPDVNKPWKKLWDEDLQPFRTMRRDFPMMLVGHACYPGITRDRTPSSLSKKFITDILRKKIGYRGLVLSDDLEMGGVLAAAPIEQAATQFIAAGGDLALICHKEEFITRAFEFMVREAEKSRAFARRAQESTRRVQAFKKKCKDLRRRNSAPSPQKLQKLSRTLWEFGEQVRILGFARENA